MDNCENCPFSKKHCQKPKNIHVKQNINGEVSEYHCCEDCSSQIIPNMPIHIMTPVMPMMLPGFSMMPVVSIQPMIATLMSNFQKLQKMEEDADPALGVHCPGCGATISDLRNIGRFGCAECYQTFKDQIEILLPQAHAGATRHCGKRPKCSVDALKKEMQKAVSEERYEDAAKFRDRIKELEKLANGDNIKTPN